jgi:hypothetical protein
MFIHYNQLEKKKKIVDASKALFEREVNVDHPMVPKRCKLLYKHAKMYMTQTGQSIRTKLDAKVFGYSRELFVLTENVTDLLEMKWIGAGVIAAYMA